MKEKPHLSLSRQLSRLARNLPFVICSSLIVCMSCENSMFSNIAGENEDEEKTPVIYKPPEVFLNTFNIEAPAGAEALTLIEAFELVQIEAAPSTNFIIDLANIPPDEPANESTDGKDYYYIPKQNINYTDAEDNPIDGVQVSIVWSGSSPEKVIMKQKTGGGGAYSTQDFGPLFTVENASLSINGRITLEGINETADGLYNNAPIISVIEGALELGGRATLENNINYNVTYIDPNTITSAVYPDPRAGLGGAIHAEYSTVVIKDNVTIQRNEVRSMYSYAEGGGIHAFWSQVSIKDNAKILYNKARGGADDSVWENIVYVPDTKIVIASDFSARGGGLCAAESSLVIEDNVKVQHNTAEGIYLENSWFSGALGGGIAASGPNTKSNCNIIIKGNVEITDNTAQALDYEGSRKVGANAFGGGIFLREKNTLSLLDNVKIERNSALAGDVSNGSSDYQNACAGGGGISTDTSDYVRLTIKDSVSISDNEAIAGTVRSSANSVNTKAYGRGGGIALGDRSVLTMTDGTIFRNKAVGGKSLSTVETKGQFFYSAGGGIYAVESESALTITGGLIEKNTAGAPGLDYYAKGGAIYLNSATDSETVMTLGGSVLIPTEVDLTPDDTEDTRNTIATVRAYNSDWDDSSIKCNFYILPFTTGEKITVDIAAYCPLNKSERGVLSYFLTDEDDHDTGARILWYDENYPNKGSAPEMPVRFLLGKFFELSYEGEGKENSRYFKYYPTDLPAEKYKIINDGKLLEVTNE